MTITFLYGGHGTYEKTENVDWPDAAPLPRIGEGVSIELKGKEVIDGDVGRISHCLSKDRKQVEIYIKVL